MTPVTVAQSRTIPVGVDDAFRITLPIELTALFSRWYGPIPPIKQVRDQGGHWERVGQTRTVILTGGGSMHEELTAVDAPASFAYRLTDITGALSPLVDHIDGEWLFREAGSDRTTVSWTWTLHPRSAAVRPLVVVLARIWRGYARGALADLQKQIALAR